MDIKNLLPNVKIKIASGLALEANSCLEQIITHKPKATSTALNKNSNGRNKPKICFVSDVKIWKNCEKFFAQNFLQTIHKALTLKDPSNDEKTIKLIKSASKNCDFILALGSGVINDLCKFVSFETGTPYAVFASAPSMNGYLSKNASLTINGHKKTVAATLPQAVFVDLKILQSCPKEMIKAGIGDSLCFYSCWFDWLLSHLLLGTKFDKKPFKILQPKIDNFLRNYKKFKLRDEELLKELIEILLLSGAGMTMVGGSYPASQSEHLIAHAFEMNQKIQNKNNIKKTRGQTSKKQYLHGLQIAITTLTVARLQERLLKAEILHKSEVEFLPNKMEKLFGKKAMRECKKEYIEKLNIIIDKFNTFSKPDWKRSQAMLKSVFLSEEKIKNVLQHFKIGTSYKSLGLKKEQYEMLKNNAKFIRARFTCLDLLDS